MSNSSGTRKCYVCKQAGHQSKDCPQAAGAKSSSATSSAAAVPVKSVAPTPVAASSASSSSESTGTRKCYVCKQPGHQSKDCPQAGAQGSRPASSSSVKKSSTGGEEKDFKARLAEFKAKTEIQPGVPKPAFCYLCGKEGHRERDCPRNTKKNEDKTCLKCGEPDHIARYCPTIANRTVYRQETKERTKGCYICSEEGHHAEECPQLEVLAEEFPKFVSKLQSGMKLNVKVYNILLEKCSRALELNGALYLYQQMQERHVEPNEDTIKHLQYLYDRGGKDQSKLKDIPQLKKRVHLLKEIVQGQKREKKTEELTDSILRHLVTYLRQPAAMEEASKQTSLFDLAKHLKNASAKGEIKNLPHLSSNDARTALTTLKSFGRYHQMNKSCEFDLGKDDSTDITQQGKFVKQDPATAKKSSKKKSQKAKKKAAAKEATATGSNGDVKDEDTEMTDVSASSSAGANKKKRKGTSDNGEDENDASTTQVTKKSKKSESKAKSESATPAAIADGETKKSSKGTKRKEAATTSDDTEETTKAASAGSSTKPKAKKSKA